MKRKILKISLVGKTNAGKSTLLNNLVGEKISITNKKINTTEDFVIGIVNIKNTSHMLPLENFEAVSDEINKFLI